MKHSEISPSNFERRMICPGSLSAEKDLPEVSSKYAEEGKLLHELTRMYIEPPHRVDQDNRWNSLTSEQQIAVNDAGNYCNMLVNNHIMKSDGIAVRVLNEKSFDLSFIYSDMKGTADTVLLSHDLVDNNIEIHVIDYKFGKGVAVSAYQNFQLILYYLGVINDPEIKKIIGNRKTSVHLHIVQPFVKNSRWDLNDEERIEIENLKFYQDVAEACYAPDAKRIASKKACQFCKAKPTCPAIAKTIPQLDINIFDLEDEEIARIYDNRELITLYLSSIEDYIKNKLNNGGLKGYGLVNKISNRKWTEDALTELPKILGEEAYETKLIGIGKAEKLLGKMSDTINKLTMKEVIGTEIVKSIKTSIDQK